MAQETVREVKVLMGKCKHQGYGGTHCSECPGVKEGLTDRNGSFRLVCNCPHHQ